MINAHARANILYEPRARSERQEDRADEPDLQHATLEFYQAAIRLLHGLKGRKAAEATRNGQQGEKTGPLDSKKTISAAKWHGRYIDHADGGVRTN